MIGKNQVDPSWIFTNMKSIGEFYFTKINPGVHMTIGINQFYFKHFMCLYDNIRDYSMTFDDYVSKSIFSN